MRNYREEDEIMRNFYIYCKESNIDQRQIIVELVSHFMQAQKATSNRS